MYFAIYSSEDGEKKRVVLFFKIYIIHNVATSIEKIMSNKNLASKNK